MGKKHVNIPLFIPHLGCPNNCVFCNQRTISGHVEFNPESVDVEIKTALSTISDGTECEIAFFGGSFTGIDRSLMIYLLKTAQKYVDAGKVQSIRLSTRPDYIDYEIISVLSSFSVKTVELGLQSLCDDVLAASKRGHDSKTALSACRMLKDAGFEVIGQMMIGLPRSDSEKEIATAQAICSAGADGARVYPTVVFYDTELADMMQRGLYEPLSLDDAIVRTKNVLDVFDRHGVPCIRVGLCASENLSDDSMTLGGANHSAIGELAMNLLYFERICAELSALGANGGDAVVYVSRGSVSKAVGQKRSNSEKICKKYNLKHLKVLEKEELLGYNIVIDYFNREEKKGVS